MGFQMIGFPLFLKLQGMRCLVFGGGEVATRKVKALLKRGAKVTCVSRDFSKELKRLTKDVGAPLVGAQKGRAQGPPLQTAIENIDIGGPALLRAAAKNHESVAVVVDPADYPVVLEEMKKHGGKVSPECRARLAQKVFGRTSLYDHAIAHYLGQQIEKQAVGAIHAEPTARHQMTQRPTAARPTGELPLLKKGNYAPRYQHSSYPKAPEKMAPPRQGIFQRPPEALPDRARNRPAGPSICHGPPPFKETPISASLDDSN